MAHHKKKRAKNRRAGCLMCKPHKANGVKKRRSGWNKGNLMDGMRRTWKQEARVFKSEQEWKRGDHD